MDYERIMAALTKEQLAEIVINFYAASRRITAKFAFTATGEVYGDRDLIDDQSLIMLLQTENKLGEMTISSEFNNSHKR